MLSVPGPAHRHLSAPDRAHRHPPGRSPLRARLLVPLRPSDDPRRPRQLDLPGLLDPPLPDLALVAGPERLRLPGPRLGFRPRALSRCPLLQLPGAAIPLLDPR